MHDDASASTFGAPSSASLGAASLGWSAEPLTRALELLSGSVGCELEPRAAWEAAAEGIADGRGDMLRSIGLAARRVGLRLGACPRVVGEPLRAAEIDGPALAWLPGPTGGSWLLLLGPAGRRRELIIIDESGERRRRFTAAALDMWLDERAEEAGATIEWSLVEALLPLASIASPTSGTGKHSAPRRLVEFARLERSELAVVAVYAVAIGALSLAVPVAAQALVNSVAIGAVLQPVVVLSLLLASVLSFVAVLRVLEYIVVESLQRRLFVRTAVDFARRLMRLSGAARREHHGPELANRFFDVVSLQKATAKLLLDTLTLMLQMGVGMALLAFYHPLLLAFDLVLMVALALVVFVFGRGAVSTALLESERKYAVAAWLEDLAASPLRFGDASARGFADARTQLLGREWLSARSQHFRRVLRQLCGGVGLQVVVGTALLGIGGMLVIQRQLTLGQLVAAELVVMAIGDSLGKLGRQLETWYDATASAAKLGKIIDLPLERSGGELLVGSGPLAVELRGLDASGSPAVELELRPGTKLGLRGVSPAHAALFDGLLALAPDDDEGLDLRLDGRPIDALELESLRSEVALVREVELVGASLLDNLDPLFAPRTAAEVGRDLCTRLREVLEQVGLATRLDTLPDGARTRLQPDGAPLRRSEARRLMLARALLRRPRLLLIDGGLDGLGLDDATHAALLDLLFAADAPWTMIVASEDPRVLARCEQTVSLPDSLSDVDGAAP